VVLRQLAKTQSSLTITDDGITVDLERCTTESLAFELRPPHASPNAFDDQVAFELGDRADDDNDCPTERTAGVDVFPR
jgi:hypothetical protein